MNTTSALVGAELEGRGDTFCPGTNRTRRKLVTRISKTITTALTFLALTGGGILAGSPPAQADGQELGGVELGGYCRSINYWGALLVEHNAYGWRCHRSTNDLRGINMDEACKWQYPAYRDRVRATYRDFNNPYSWYCFVN